MIYITKIFAISRFHSKDCFNTQKGVNDVFREIQRLEEYCSFGRMDGLMQKEDKQIVWTDSISMVAALVLLLREELTYNYICYR